MEEEEKKEIEINELKSKISFILEEFSTFKIRLDNIEKILKIENPLDSQKKYIKMENDVNSKEIIDQKNTELNNCKEGLIEESKNIITQEKKNEKIEKTLETPETKSDQDNEKISNVSKEQKEDISPVGIKDIPEGYKEIQLENGNIFKGYFKNGKKEGKGNCVNQKGDLIYGGIFKDDKLISGSCVLNDDRYEHKKFEGKFDGKDTILDGKLYGFCGLLYSGTFKNNLYDGYGELYNYDMEKRSNLLIYKGNFKEGKYHGDGTQYIKDEQIIGKYENGCLVKDSYRIISDNSNYLYKNGKVWEGSGFLDNKNNYKFDGTIKEGKFWEGKYASYDYLYDFFESEIEENNEYKYFSGNIKNGVKDEYIFYDGKLQIINGKLENKHFYFPGRSSYFKGEIKNGKTGTIELYKSRGYEKDDDDNYLDDYRCMKYKIKNGKREGNFKKYSRYKNEKVTVLISASYSDNNVNGKVLTYSDWSNRLEQEYYCKNGKREGILKKYGYDRVSAKQIYKNGKLEGNCFEYDNDGSISKDSIYKNGELIEEKEFYKKKILSEFKLIDGIGTRIIYNQNEKTYEVIEGDILKEVTTSKESGKILEKIKNFKYNFIQENILSENNIITETKISLYNNAKFSTLLYEIYPNKDKKIEKITKHQDGVIKTFIFTSKGIEIYNNENQKICEINYNQKKMILYLDDNEFFYEGEVEVYTCKNEILKQFELKFPGDIYDNSETSTMIFTPYCIGFKKNGKGTEYFSKKLNKIKSESTYYNGKKHGVYVEYYLNGKKSCEGYWKYGVPNKDVTYFDELGNEINK